MTLQHGIIVSDSYSLGSCGIYRVAQVCLAVWHIFLLSYSQFLYFILASFTVGTWSFPGVKSGRGVTLTPHPF